jgi:ribosome-associated protein
MFPPAKRQESASEAPAPASKSQRKRQMHDLQQLGESLARLDPGRLAALGLPEKLADAIALARRITQHEGRRRQLQYVGRLMRDVDPDPLRAAIAASESGPALDRARFAAAERWRERLLLEPEGVAEFASAHPQVDPAALAMLVAAARAEREVDAGLVGRVDDLVGRILQQC